MFAMLLPREKKILELLYKSKREWTTAELANSLHISPRTVKTDVRRIKEELKDTGCMLETKTGKGLWLSCDRDGRAFLNNLLLHADSPCSYAPEARKYFIAAQLLDSDDFISMESISLSLYVSKGTVMNDIARLEEFFLKQGLVLEKKAKYGVRIRGEEKQLRIAKANVLRSIIAAQGSSASERLQPFFDGIDVNRINEILQESEETFNFVLTDASYSEMLTHLSIIVKRLRRKKFCTIDEEHLVEYRRKEEWPVCEFMGRKLQEAFDIELSNGDITYIYMNLTAARLLREAMTLPKDFDDSQDASPQTLAALEHIIGQVDERYGEHLLADNMFTTALFVHLTAMFNRLRNKIHMENPLKAMVKKDLAYEFEVAAYMAGLFEEQFQVTLGENELCDIALYVGASLEREKAQRQVTRPRVAIVCSTGMGTSQFVEARLKSCFPDMVIDKILPVSKVERVMDNSPVDFIISTVPLTYEKVKVICVSPLLNDDDIHKIKQEGYSAPETAPPVTTGDYHHLFQLMSERITILKCDCRSKEEVIELLGGRLYREGFVDEGFVESVFVRENLAPTSIGYTFAIPHAYMGHIKKQGIGLMTLKHPIPWDNGEKVQIVLMLSIDVKSSDAFKIIFSQLADLTKDLPAVEQILKADRLSEILRYFKIN